MTYPWEKLTGEADDPRRLAAEANTQAAPPHDPLMFVRLRIQHGDNVRSVGIRADDKDITGRIPLSDGTHIAITAWGVPIKGEVLATSQVVLEQVIKYLNEQGLQIVKK